MYEYYMYNTHPASKDESRYLSTTLVDSQLTRCFKNTKNEKHYCKSSTNCYHPTTQQARRIYVANVVTVTSQVPGPARGA